MVEIYNYIKGLIVGKKKKAKKTSEAKVAQAVPMDDVEATAEELMADGYVFLKVKGDMSIYVKDSQRISVKTKV